MKKWTKYHAAKTTVNGIVFDSKKEAKHYYELLKLQEQGEITDLQRQVKFLLIPKQVEPDKVGPKGGITKGRVIEREVAYIADFTYRDVEGNLIVEDTKGVRTPEYVIKRKLMLQVHGIRVREI